MSDRFLIGFIGFLSVYQSIQILRRGGVFNTFHLQQLDEAVDLLVNALYLLATLTLRISNHDRFEKIFRLRLAEAEIQTKSHGHDPLLHEQTNDPKVLGRLRAAAPLLSGNALKLYLYICFQADFQSGIVRATEDELLQFLSNDKKALHTGFRELQERGLCEVDQEPSGTAVHVIADVAPEPAARVACE